MTKLMKAEFHLAVSVPGSQYYACWLTVIASAYWILEYNRAMVIVISNACAFIPSQVVCCEKKRLIIHAFNQFMLLKMNPDKSLEVSIYRDSKVQQQEYLWKTISAENIKANRLMLHSRELRQTVNVRIACGRHEKNNTQSDGMADPASGCPTTPKTSQQNVQNRRYFDQHVFLSKHVLGI